MHREEPEKELTTTPGTGKWKGGGNPPDIRETERRKFRLAEKTSERAGERKWYRFVRQSVKDLGRDFNDPWVAGYPVTSISSR